MRHLVALLALGTAAAADIRHGLDVYAFGVSYHTNRDYPWKEFNPGLGASPFVALNDHVEAFVMSGSYRNSTGRGTTIELAGIRVLNDYKDFQYGVTAGYGILTGYSDNPVRALVGVFAGWRWVTAEAAYRPASGGNEEVAGTALVCGWFRFRVFSF